MQFMVKKYLLHDWLGTSTDSHHYQMQTSCVVLSCVHRQNLIFLLSKSSDAEKVYNELQINKTFLIQISRFYLT